LAEIFGLKSILNVAPNESPNKVEQLKLDFQYMNYGLCKEQKFSNEQTSTLLGIFDFVLNLMLEKQLSADQGRQRLRQILAEHSIHRPPFSIYVFAERHIKAIIDFATTTFLRHFSLYEFAFKPRVELVLKTQPPMVTAFNSCIEPLGEMEVVEAEEAAKMKAFLGGAGFGALGMESMHSTGEGPSAMTANREERASMHAEEVNDEIGDKDLGEDEKA